MRRSNEIAIEIRGLMAADEKYNTLVNEGGDGFSREDPRLAELNAEFVSVRKRDFASEWTREAFDARRAAWNAAVAPIVAAKKPVDGSTIREIERSLGFRLADLQTAKTLFLR